MNLEDLIFAQEYFTKKCRNPKIAEIKVLDTYRSDHCRHTTFNTEIKNVEFDIYSTDASEDADKVLSEIIDTEIEYDQVRTELGRKNMPNTLMEVATMGTRYLKKHPKINPNIQNLVQSEEINACTFRTTITLENNSTEEREILFKNETHNHPTEIEPFGGAATCL
jgi:phosphoribosylformylglycinamidine synthase